MTPNLVAASSIAPEEVLPVTDINPNLRNNRSTCGPSFFKRWIVLSQCSHQNFALGSPIAHSVEKQRTLGGQEH